MAGFGLVLFVKGLPPLMQHFMLRVDRGGVRFEREQMGLEFFEVSPVTHCAELRTVDPVELFHQFGMS
jgi:hypothetical protein